MAEPAAPAPRNKGRPTLDEAEQIDHVIRAAAMQVLCEQGEAATLHAVARAAGLSRKSLYARYPTKAVLFLEVVRDVLTISDPVQFSRGATFEDSLRNYLTAALSSINSSAAQAIRRLLLLNPDYIATLRAEMAMAMQRLFADPVRRLVQDAVTLGEITVVDEDLTVESILKLIAVFDLKAEPVRAEQERLEWAMRQADFLTGFICRGLAPSGDGR